MCNAEDVRKDSLKRPIDYLKKNILARFENTNPNFLHYIEELVERGVIEKRINYLSEDDKIIMPYVGSDKCIYLQSTFLCFLWIHCYYGLVIYEELVVKYFENKQQGKNHVLNNELIKRTVEFQKYAMSLFVYYSEWDLTIYPGPNTKDTSGKEYHILANQLFLYAIDYIMCHEFAHLELGHFSSSKATIEKEREADRRAFELLLADRDGKNNMSIEMGVLLGLSGLLFTGPSVSGGKSHPDKHERIKTYLELLNPPCDSPTWSVACYMISVWDNKFSKNIEFPSTVADHKEMFYILYDRMC